MVLALYQTPSDFIIIIIFQKKIKKKRKEKEKVKFNLIKSTDIKPQPDIFLCVIETLTLTGVNHPKDNACNH